MRVLLGRTAALSFNADGPTIAIRKPERVLRSPTARHMVSPEILQLVTLPEHRVVCGWSLQLGCEVAMKAPLLGRWFYQKAVLAARVGVGPRARPAGKSNWNEALNTSVRASVLGVVTGIDCRREGSEWVGTGGRWGGDEK